MEKKPDHIAEAKTQLKTLESELASSEQRLRSARESKQKTMGDLANARTQLIESDAHISEVLIDVASGTASADDLKTARQAVKDLQAEIADHEAILKAHAPVEGKISQEVNDLRSKVTTERKLFWATVAEGLEEKCRKTMGDLLRQALACRELNGHYMFDGAGQALARIFFDSSAPMLEKEKAELVKKFLE